MLTLEAFIHSRVNISDEALREALAHFRHVSFRKGKHVLVEGQICMDYYFVSEGALRVYYRHKGEDVTGWIALEGAFFTDPSTLANGSSPRVAVEAIENSKVAIISHQQMSDLYAKYPVWQEFGRKVWEEAFINLINAVVSFQSDDAAQRYVKAVSTSNSLLQRVSLKHLSSYLGITATSLSRLRKKLK